MPHTHKSLFFYICGIANGSATQFCNISNALNKKHIMTIYQEREENCLQERLSVLEQTGSKDTLTSCECANILSFDTQIEALSLVCSDLSLSDQITRKIPN